MIHTCRQHAPGETCYKRHGCRCVGCRAAHAVKDRNGRHATAQPCDRIDVSEEVRAAAEATVTKRGAADLIVMLGLDLPAVPPAAPGPGGDGPRWSHRTRDRVRGEKVG